MRTPEDDDPPAPPRTRSQRVRDSLGALSELSWRSLVVVAALIGLGYLLGQIWVIVLPIVLALFLTTLLWPGARWLRSHRWPPALAAATIVLAFLGVLAAVFAVIVLPVAEQADDVVTGIEGGLERIEEWVSGPPLNLGDDAVGQAVDDGVAQLQERAGDIVGIVLGGVGAIGSALVAIALILILIFFFLKDGPKFLPWLAEQTGPGAGRHVRELGSRYFASLASFMRSQMVVGLLDAVAIGIGLLIIGVPLVLPLSLLTFLGAFVPVIGAFVAGGVAVLVALVSNGPVAALIVLAIIVVVQQLEGNVFAPILQGKSLHLHAAVVILVVIAGSSVAGITGAFLAVPVAALTAITWRYARTQLEDRPTEPEPADEPPAGSDPPAE